MSRKISEDQTRKQMIDPQLEKAGWYLRDHTKVKIEIPVDGYNVEPWNGVTDYCLNRENGDDLAVSKPKLTPWMSAGPSPHARLALSEAEVWRRCFRVYWRRRL